MNSVWSTKTHLRQDATLSLKACSHQVVLKAKDSNGEKTENWDFIV